MTNPTTPDSTAQQISITPVTSAPPGPRPILVRPNMAAQGVAAQPTAPDNVARGFPDWDLVPASPILNPRRTR